MRLPHTRRSRAVVAIAATCATAVAVAGVTVALGRGGDSDLSAGTTPAGSGAGGSDPASTGASTKPTVSRPSTGQPARSSTQPVRKPPSPSAAKPSTKPTTKATAKPTSKPPTKPDPIPQQGNPLSQTSGLYVDPQSEPVYWVGAHGGDSRRAIIKAGIADRPIGRWFNGDGADASDARAYVSAASRVRKLPVLVFYHHPERDCEAGEGAASAAAYRSWIDSMAASIGKRPAVVVLEPDALPGLDCLSSSAQTTRLSLVSYAVERLRSSAPNTWTYLDAGHDDWNPAATMAKRLNAAGIAHARGFALNVSNYQSTARNVSYAQGVNAVLGSAKHFVIDTSRNGNPLNGDDWCNPTGQRVGAAPRTGGASGLDLQLWVKPPGESDGDCGLGTGTEAGDFSPAIAMKLLGH
ncbi:glycoside hydrolase family 6 protein [Streptomyces sp. SID13031]|uniref:glycoside hydrolase family 6 protein n=1 Tax=Streptomyces sp. SID13031 TaxID=2706046 RepID=UPI0013CA16C7|nr:glycoside hydrolase family 6 protein [Streptomyces sp. SID13031]NEA30674.1 endoglucanase [Streptomyces sp. SID13031]